MKASQQAIERGVKDCLFIDYKRRSGHFDVTTVASIKEITDKVAPFCVCFFFFHQILSGGLKWPLRLPPISLQPFSGANVEQLFISLYQI